MRNTGNGLRLSLHTIVIFCVVINLFSCAPKPFSDTNRIYRKKSRELAKQISARPVDSIQADSLKYPADWAGTTNFSLRKPNYVILHHTAQNSCQETIKTFTLERTNVSAHYVICKDGTLFHMLNDYLRAWHAGAGMWGSNTDINSSSIGIEIDNNGRDPFTEAQINTLLGVLTGLKKAYNFPVANFIGHSDIAPGRKVDPQVLFPWKRLAEKGFGYWYNDTLNLAIPAGFQVTQGLKIIGYDISKPAAASEAFRRHYLQAEKPGELTEPEKKVLYALMQKYL